VEEFGPKATEALLEAGNRIPTITIRTNIAKISRDALLKKLAKEEVQGKATFYAPAGILLDPFRGGVEALTTFREGLFQVQDEAAQITSHILGPKAGEIILDICSGLGGKTSHLAELMGGTGRVVSLDIDHRRLLNLRRNAKRLGIHGILPMVADASGPLTPLFRVAFDRILIDAPCSGLGVLSRHPDGKWHKSQSDIERLSELQYAILDRAAGLLKTGGCLLYVTCTLSREENEGVVQRFLERREEFRLENIGQHLPSWGQDLVDEQGFFKTLPHVHHMDGFFAALFLRR
jgi:16S rRNA (cytosine967-C5)-methyltransferase